jgi:hypothetical protein
MVERGVSVGKIRGFEVSDAVCLLFPVLSGMGSGVWLDSGLGGESVEVHCFGNILYACLRGSDPIV